MALPQPRPATIRNLRGGGIEISDKDNLEEAIMAENKGKFLQQDLKQD